MIKAKQKPGQIAPKNKWQRLGMRVWDYRELYLMLLPTIIYVFIFNYVPMYGVIIGFQDMKIGDPYGSSTWVGLYHFKTFFEGAFIEMILKNTLLITVIGMFLSIPCNLGLALLLHNSNSKFIKKSVQTISYIPNLLALTIIVAILKLFVNAEGGLINIALNAMGKETIDFMGENWATLPMYFISGIWAGTGAGAIIYLGALAGVDEEMIEAARIDGANKLRIIWNIQLPSIKPTVVTMMIMNFGKVFAVGADKLLLMQNELNLESTEVISTYVYKEGVVGARYSFTTAVGMFSNVCNIVMLSIVNFIADKMTGMGIF